MQANKTHISLETAKLLEDCGVESAKHWHETKYEGYKIEYGKVPEDNNNEEFTDYPAFTWQEILWENADKFFGVIYERDFSKEILFLLQQKKYEEADKYLRDHCILINTPKQ